jgi:hypothetical protein
MSSTDKKPAIPGYIASKLPSYEHTRRALSKSVIELPAGTEFIRAAWNDASVWPGSVQRTYRFGPPKDLAGADGSFPFHWIYVASDVMTAVWEARFCANDVTRPGTFYIEPQAGEAKIARFTFDSPIRLIDLAGASASKLGIFDMLASPDHEWCQWFGCVLERVIASRRGAIDGIFYMSRKHPGHRAFAISSKAMARLDAHRSTSLEKFKDTSEFLQLQDDPCFVLPP